jgi:hypothetical protein
MDSKEPHHDLAERKLTDIEVFLSEQGYYHRECRKLALQLACQDKNHSEGVALINAQIYYEWLIKVSK